MTRKLENVDVLQRFRKVLENYYKEEKQFKNGLPSVGFCADKLCMSPGYLGDLVRRKKAFHLRNIKSVTNEKT